MNNTDSFEHLRDKMISEEDSNAHQDYHNQCLAECAKLNKQVANIHYHFGNDVFAAFDRREKKLEAYLADIYKQHRKYYDKREVEKDPVLHAEFWGNIAEASAPYAFMPEVTPREYAAIRRNIRAFTYKPMTPAGHAAHKTCLLAFARSFIKAVDNFEQQHKVQLALLPEDPDADIPF